VAPSAWLPVVGLAWGVLAGLTESAEKTWLADLAPRDGRAAAFGALAIVSAGAALAGNATAGWLFATDHAPGLLALAALALAGVLVVPRRR
jgi:MFS family permease